MIESMCAIYYIVQKLSKVSKHLCQIYMFFLVNNFSFFFFYLSLQLKIEVNDLKIFTFGRGQIAHANNMI